MKELDLFDKPKNVKRLLVAFYVCLGILLVIDPMPFIHKHHYIPWESAPNFFAAYGFVSCVALIYIAKFLRLFLKRDEDYYDRQG